MKKAQESNHAQNQAFKAGALYFVAEMITRGCSFLATPVFTRLLPAEVFADAKVFESWVYLLAPVLCVCVYQCLPRAKFDFEDYRGFLSGILSLIALLGLGAVLLCLVFQTAIINVLHFELPLILLMLVYSVGYNGIQSIQMYDRQILNYRRNILMTFLGVLPGLLISVVLVCVFRGKVSNQVLLNLRVVGFFLPIALIGLAFLIFFCVTAGKRCLDLKVWRYSVRYSFPLMLTMFTAQVFFQSGSIFVRNIIGSTEAAIVLVAMTVGYIMDILIHALDNAWKPWMYECLHQGKTQKLQKMWLLLLTLIAGMALGGTLFAPELVMIIGGNDYTSAIPLIYPILCSAVANFVMITFVSLEQYYKRTRISGIASVLAIAINIVLNYVCVVHFGYLSVVYVLFASYVLGSMIHYVFLYRRGEAKVLRPWLSMAIVLGTFVCSTVLPLTYTWSFLQRFLLAAVVILLLVCIFFKKGAELLKNWRENQGKQ